MRSQGWQGLVERMLILTHPIDPSGEKKSGEKGPRMSFFPVNFVPIFGADKTLWVKNPFDIQRAGWDGSAVLLSAL